jgi:hypothetical protein
MKNNITDSRVYICFGWDIGCMCALNGFWGTLHDVNLAKRPFVWYLVNDKEWPGKHYIQGTFVWNLHIFLLYINSALITVLSDLSIPVQCFIKPYFRLMYMLHLFIYLLIVFQNPYTGVHPMDIGTVKK